MTSDSLISRHRHGFIKMHFTTTNLFGALSEWKTSLKNQNFTRIDCCMQYYIWLLHSITFGWCTVLHLAVAQYYLYLAVTRLQVLQFDCYTVLHLAVTLAHSIKIWMLHSTTIWILYCIWIWLLHCSTVLQLYRLQRFITNWLTQYYKNLLKLTNTVLQFDCYTVLQFDCYTVLQFDCYTVLQFDCYTVLQFDCYTVLQFDCYTVLQFGCWHSITFDCYKVAKYCNLTVTQY